MLLVVDSGLAVDYATVKQIALRALSAAFAGVAGPVLLGMAAVALLRPQESWVTGLTVGAALAPTSMGFSAQLLKEFGQLQSSTGQLVVTAAVMDDVLSLVLVTVVQVRGRGRRLYVCLYMCMSSCCTTTTNTITKLLLSLSLTHPFCSPWVRAPL